MLFQYLSRLNLNVKQIKNNILHLTKCILKNLKYCIKRLLNPLPEFKLQKFYISCNTHFNIQSYKKRKVLRDHETRFFIKIFIKIKKSYFKKPFFFFFNTTRCASIYIYLHQFIFHQFAKHVYLSITEKKSDNCKLMYVRIFASCTTTDKSMYKIV